MNDTDPQHSKSEANPPPKSTFWLEVAKGVLIAVLVAAILAIPFRYYAKQIIGFITPRELGSPIGTIVASLLPPAQFAQDAPGTWLPLEGQPVPQDSPYFKLTGRDSLPDFRGLFLRGLNEFTPAKRRTDQFADPDGAGRVAGGDPQPDAFKSHKHTLFIGVRDSVESHGTHYFSGHLADQNRDTPDRPGLPMTQAPSVTETGDRETRPKNMAVYYYIRIR